MLVKRVSEQLGWVAVTLAQAPPSLTYPDAGVWSRRHVQFPEHLQGRVGLTWHAISHMWRLMPEAEAGPRLPARLEGMAEPGPEPRPIWAHASPLPWPTGRRGSQPYLGATWVTCAPQGSAGGVRICCQPRCALRGGALYSLFTRGGL